MILGEGYNTAIVDDIFRTLPYLPAPSLIIIEVLSNCRLSTSDIVVIVLKLNGSMNQSLLCCCSLACARWRMELRISIMAGILVANLSTNS